MEEGVACGKLCMGGPLPSKQVCVEAESLSTTLPQGLALKLASSPEFKFHAEAPGDAEGALWF